MNATYVQRGDYIDYTPSEDIAAGDVVAAGGLVGISKIGIRAGELGAIAVTGVYDVTKDGSAFAVGDRVGWDPENRKATGSGGVPLGVCVLASAASDTSVRVLLAGEGGTAAGTAGTGTGTGGAGGGEGGGDPGVPPAIADVTLASVTGGGAWSGGDGNANMVTDFRAFRDAINAVLAALRARGIVGEA